MTAVCSTILNFKASILESRSEFEFQCRSAKRIGIEYFPFFQSLVMLPSTIASLFDGNFPNMGQCEEVFEYLSPKTLYDVFQLIGY